MADEIDRAEQLRERGRRDRSTGCSVNGVAYVFEVFEGALACAHFVNSMFALHVGKWDVAKFEAGCSDGRRTLSGRWVQ